MKALITGAAAYRLRPLRRAARPRRRRRRPHARPRAGPQQANPRVSWHPWEPDPGAARRPRPSRASTGSSTSSASRSTSAGPTRRRSGSSRVAAAATRNLVDAINAGLIHKPRVLVNQSAIGYYGDRGEAIVDEDDGAGRRLRRRGRHPGVGGGGGEVGGPAPPGDHPHRPRPRPRPRASSVQLLTPVQARRRRPGRRRSPVPADRMLAACPCRSAKITYCLIGVGAGHGGCSAAERSSNSRYAGSTASPRRARRTPLEAARP